MNLISKYMKYFDLTRRKEYSKIIIIILTACGYASYVVIHNYCIEKYVDVLSFYRYGKPQKPPNEMLKIIEETKTTFNNYNKKFPITNENLNFFLASGFDTVSVGSFYLKKGGYIGIPVNFKYKNFKDIETEKIMTGNYTIPWYKDDDNIIAESLVLSENAQKYAIIRELFNLTYPHIYWKSGFCGSTILLTYFSARYVNEKKNLYAKHILIRTIINCFIMLIGLSGFFALKQTIDSYYRRKTDKSIVKLGIDYVNGAFEYCDKMVRRREVLHNILQGNESSFIQPNSDLYLRSRNYFLSEQEKFKSSVKNC